MRLIEHVAVSLAPHRDFLNAVFYSSIAIEALCFLGYLIQHGDIYGAATIATPWVRDMVKAVKDIAIAVRGNKS